MVINVYGDFCGKTTIHSKGGTKVVVCMNCLLSGNVVIRNNDGYDVIGNDGVVLNKDEAVKIKPDVWIREETRTLKGNRNWFKQCCWQLCCCNMRGNFSDGNMVIAGNPARRARKFADDETWRKIRR